MIQQFRVDDVEYSMTPHNPMEGLEVIDLLLTLGIGPALAALTGLDESDDASLSDLDIPSLTSALQAGLRGAGGISRLAPLVLKHTYRGEVKLDAEGINESYTQNYGELSRAVFEVIKRNGFFDALLGFWSDNGA